MNKLLLALAILTAISAPALGSDPLVAWIYATYFDSKEQQGLRLIEPKSAFNKLGFGWGVAACIVGAAVSVSAIWLPFR